MRTKNKCYKYKIVRIIFFHPKKYNKKQIEIVQKIEVVQCKQIGFSIKLQERCNSYF